MLRDKVPQVRITARIRQIETGNLGDWQSVLGDVSELRVHVGPGYRLHFVRRQRVVVILFGGGDKSSQGRDIARAVRLAESIGDEE